MRIAIYGGSFNPPHVGHAMVAGWLRWTEQADEVWLVPTFVHAFSKDLAPYDERTAWCEALARSVGPWVRVEGIERELPPPSYTVDTLDALARRHPEHQLRLVVGADILESTAEWKQWPRISQAYTPIVVGRQGYPPVAGTLAFPAVSSTEVRRRLRDGEPVAHLLGAEVARLVEASGCFVS